MFAIGDKQWAGLSKLVEEAGVVTQVAGKLMGTRGETAHWDGSNLRERLVEELGDLQAAMLFVIRQNGIDLKAVEERTAKKLALFEIWQESGQ